MKQIFDWLREQIRNREITADFRIKELLKNNNTDDDFKIQAGKQMAFLETFALINEAEAKWKKEYVSIGAYKQVAWERDIAIEQLHDLGYEFGEKIREAETCEWRKENSNKYVCYAHVETYDSRVLEWCLCPYCGNPIKITEV